MQQALRIRLELLRQKNEAIKLFSTNRAESIRILQTCVKNEKNFLSIMKEAIPRSIFILTNIKKIFTEVQLREYFVTNINKIVKIMEYSNSKLEMAQKIIEVENQFILTPSDELLRILSNLIKEEQNIYSKILSKKDSELVYKMKDEIYQMKKVISEYANNHKAYIVGGGVGLAGSAIMNYFSVQPPDLETVIATTVGLTALSSVCVGFWTFLLTLGSSDRLKSY
jgi:hypothetical protein